MSEDTLNIIVAIVWTIVYVTVCIGCRRHWVKGWDDRPEDFERLDTDPLG